MVGHRGVLGEGQQRGARAAGELGGNTWSGAGAVAGLGRRGTTICGGVVARHRGSRGGRRTGGCQGLICELQKLQGP
jgi:hypothetical protein